MLQADSASRLGQADQVGQELELDGRELGMALGVTLRWVDHTKTEDRVDEELGLHGRELGMALEMTLCGGPYQT